MNWSHTGPQAACLTHYEADMLRAFFHLACQIEGGSENKIRIRLADLILDIEPLEIYLSGSNRLLAGSQALAQLDEFCQGSDIAIVMFATD